MTDDAELLRRYAEEGAEDAFAELVQRHVNFVYSAALRQLNGDAHLAADAAQLVFTDLARKAGSLAGHRVLAGWLFTSTRFATAKLIRGERRRHAREEAAHLMHELTDDPAARDLDWRLVRPVLDEALAELSENDRQAVLLRFFEGCDYARLGARLNLSDNTARMRVERALDKLRVLVAKRGVTSTSSALAAALASQAVSAAPAGLAAAITGAALAGGGGAVAASSTLLGLMSMTKLQVGLSGALAVAATTGFVMQANTNAALRATAAQLQTEAAAVTPLQRENDQLARTLAEAAELRRDDAEFVRLQEEAGALRIRLQEIEKQRARAASQAMYERSQLDTQPSPVFQARPSYPAALRQAGITGEVVVDFVVDASGTVQKAFAARSTQREFEQAAIDAVSKWRFRAGRKGGRDVNTHMQVPIVFSLANVAESQRLSDQPAKAGADAVKLLPFVIQSGVP